MLEQCRGLGGVGRNLRGSSGHAQVEGRPQPKGRNFRIHLVTVPPQSSGTYRPGCRVCDLQSRCSLQTCGQGSSVLWENISHRWEAP